MVPLHSLKYIISAVVLAAVLALLEWAYIRVARRNHIGVTASDKGRRRFVAVGGGFIFILAAIMAVAVFPATAPYIFLVYMYVGGGAILAVLSYADDLITLSPRLRLGVHIAVTALVLALMPFGSNYLLYACAVIACTGYMNASNFMDGINGMLALYSGVVLATLACVMPSPVVLALLVSTAVFAAYNCRREPSVYSGDVGSITIGFFIATSLVYYILDSDEYSAAVFVLVFLIDAFCTFMERLLRGDNVFMSHRRHLYQLLIRRRAHPLTVSAGYAAVQLAVNGVWLMLPEAARPVYAIASAAILLTLYIFIRIFALKKYNA